MKLTLDMEVIVAFIDCDVRARVVSPPNRFGWVRVEQITGYEGVKDRPRYLAAIEYVSLPSQLLRPPQTW